MISVGSKANFFKTGFRIIIFSTSVFRHVLSCPFHRLPSADSPADRAEPDLEVPSPWDRKQLLVHGRGRIPLHALQSSSSRPLSAISGEVLLQPIILHAEIYEYFKVLDFLYQVPIGYIFTSFSSYSPNPADAFRWDLIPKHFPWN